MMLGQDVVDSMSDARRCGLVNGAIRYAVAAHFLLALLAYSPLAIGFYLLAIMYVLPYSLLEACGAFWLERRAGLPRDLGFGLLWTGGEWLRTLGDLSFPADLAAHGFGLTPAFSRFTSWTGPFGVPLWCTVIGVALARAWRARRERRRALPPALFALAVWLAAPIHGYWTASTTTRATTPLHVALVQPAVSIDMKILAENHDAAWRLLRRLTQQAAAGVDLVVWPESARPGWVIWDEAQPFGDPEMEALSREVGVSILYGAQIARARDKQVLAAYNGAVLVHADGTAPQWYGKQRLLPLAEGVPFGDLFGWDPAKRAQSKDRRSYLTMLGNFTRGPEPTIFRVKGLKIGVLVCYEGMYPQLGRTYANHGANLLAVMTNDIWWGRSIFAGWHAQMIAARANELDLPVIRAANSGVSSVTDGLGQMGERTKLFDQTTMRVTVDLENAPRPTFYARRGDWVIGLTWSVLGIALLRGLLRPVARR